MRDPVFHDEVSAIHLPYCIKRLEDRRYIVLNRNYKPVGFTTREHLDYASYPVAVRLEGLNQLVASKLFHCGSTSLDEIWLYDDGSIPTRSSENMDAYLERLKIFAEMKIIGQS